MASTELAAAGHHDGVGSGLGDGVTSDNPMSCDTVF
jgi:hypothetical protein